MTEVEGSVEIDAAAAAQLVEAAKSCNEGRVRELLASGVPGNAIDDGVSALCRAAEEGAATICTMLLDAGADIDYDGRWGSPLSLAAKKGRLNVVTLLVERGANINLNPSFGGALGKASAEGHMHVVQYLVDQPACDINAASSFGRGLYAACRYGKLDVARFLISRGADVNLKDDFGTPLSVACDNNQLACAQLLVQHGARINATDVPFGVAIKKAAGSNHIDIVTWLISEGADVHLRGRNSSETALFAAAENGAGDAVRVLLENGASACDECDGKTALFAAAKKGSVRCVELLLENGAMEVLNRAYNGQTPRDIAVEKSHLSVRDLIDRFVADPPQPAVTPGAAVPAIAAAPAVDMNELSAMIDAKLSMAVKGAFDKVSKKIAALGEQQEELVQKQPPVVVPEEVLERLVGERLDAAFQRMEQQFEERLQQRIDEIAAAQPKKEEPESGCLIM